MVLTLTHDAEPRERRVARRTIRSRRRALDIALVNNMPDLALRSTERQFRAAIQAGGGQTPIRLHLYTLPGVTRSEEAQRYFAEGYGDFEDLLSRSFDAVLVTGNEPRAARLDDEPYWRDLVRLIEWTDANTKSSLWSCLAAHAAVLHLHGIGRHRLATKLSGVFESRIRAVDPLLEGMAARIVTPHSRWNELRKDDLLAHGYQILSESPDAGVDMFTLQRESRFVFLQGHPEYDTDSLLREYRRDVGRYLHGEMPDYPAEPANYFSDEAAAVLRAFRRRSIANRDGLLFDVFPNVASPFAITNRWQAWTSQFYRNWLEGIAAQDAKAGASA